MIPFSFGNRPNVFQVSILLNLIQLFFTTSGSSLHINNPSHLNQSTIEIHQFIDPNPNSVSSPMPAKKLRRLPHVFSKVLELPLRSNADVFIEDRSECFRFRAKIEDNAFSGEVKAHAVKIHPEVTKVVVRGGNGGGEVELLLDKLEVDVWRFRLPATSRPELATAVFLGGELIVTVPKAWKVEDGKGRLGRLQGRLVYAV
ncbi:uncharacterized protein LOC112518349 [Cynara cardunculus var. scolymus]|uniref:Alpha crystallin/Hsp20 domain-containing protein n=1 Tax=Cynara cardunculus var. scolymus TaxID=59895 RepID=A0A103XPR5_CYNCS|nr:uncharacterized protein LOC112518349 [Cynara cardunculus var. scolymus]KVH94608.1 hypothetical protein Ccrd_003320 [Cynara cardunculus var. scolymus]